MTPRISTASGLPPESIKSLIALDRSVGTNGLELALSDWICLRTSQINRGPFCISMHTIALRKRGRDDIWLGLRAVPSVANSRAAA